MTVASLHEGQVIHIRHRLSHARIAGIINKCDIPYQSSPVVLYLFGCGLRAGDAGIGRHAGGMGVEAFEIEGIRRHGTIQRPSEIRAAGVAHNDVLKVLEFATRKSFYEALPGSFIDNLQVVVDQRFAPARAVIRKSRRITIVRWNNNGNVLGLGDRGAKIEAVRRSVRPIKTDDRRLGRRFFSAQQRLKWNCRGNGRSGGCAFE